MKQDVAAKKPGTFSKGDPRINRKGRPKTFDALRKLAQSIGHEDALGEDGQPVTVNGQPVTATEAILRMWSMSGNPTLQMKFVEVAYGKVPEDNGSAENPSHVVTHTHDEWVADRGKRQQQAVAALADFEDE